VRAIGPADQAIDTTMREELAARPDAVALACMDTRSGLLLGLEVKGDARRDDVEMAAFSAAQVLAAPGSEEDAPDLSDESFIASARWVHAYARVPKKKDLVVVALAPGDANVALLRAWIRQIAERVGPHA